MSNLLFATKLVSKLSTSIFAGSAFYCGVVEHSATLKTGSNAGIDHWRHMYERAAPIQAGLSVVAFSSAFGAYHLTKDKYWLAAGLLMSTLIPYTLLVMMPTNKRMLDKSLDKESSTAKDLLEKWGWMHSVRSIIGLFALVLTTSIN